MADPLSTKKEFPAQARERLQWVLDTVRNNQKEVFQLLWQLQVPELLPGAKNLLTQLHKHDRDALLISGGILTDEQIKALDTSDQQPSVDEKPEL